MEIESLGVDGFILPTQTADPREAASLRRLGGRMLVRLLVDRDGCLA
jgi:hypothetical protein